MTFLSVLDTFFLGPLKLLFEVIFHIAYDVIGNPGLSIIFLSLAMNVLVLPLYMRADKMQEAARDTEARLHDGIAHIKKTFSGNERMMMLQAYYRQNDYSPTNALRGSVSLLLEIPFFMAAYQFLSNLGVLKGIPFGPIADLSAPDGLITIGAVTLNLLPILMTLINFISSAIYLRGFPLKTKLQLYGIAIVFLVLLYNSPSGLVFYWTLNNVFSLIKNIFYKLKNPKKVLTVITTLLGAGMIALYFGASKLGVPQFERRIVPALGILLLLPLVLLILSKILPKKETAREAKPNKALFIASAVFLSAFIGVLIPSNCIASATLDFVDVTYYCNPLWYVASSFLLASGTFILWFGVFYWLMSPVGKVIFERVMFMLCGVAVVDYMFFGTKLGILTEALEYENGLVFTRNEKLLNLAIVVAVAALLFFIAVKWKKAAKAIVSVAAAALIVMSGINVITAGKAVSEVKLEEYGSAPHFTLSKNGKNVVVLFLDRACGEYFPYIMNEDPELLEKFDGFTYYNNTISFGGYTNFGTPPLVGGYEYTPVEMNRRSDEPLADKHNESLKVMPVTFLENGYDVTVCDPPYAGYKWIPDLTIFDDYPEINKYLTKGFFGSPKIKQMAIDGRMRNFFCFSFMKSIPLAVQYVAYDNGDYNALPSTTDADLDSAADLENEEASSTQSGEDTHTGEGLNGEFMDAYNALRNLSNMTDIESDGDNFLMFYNDTPHREMILKEPEYVPVSFVDNTEYDASHEDRFTIDGMTLKTESRRQMMLYHVNASALNVVGEWIDFLRDNGVYDNTKIIIVADHGYYLHQLPELCFEDCRMPSGMRIDTGNYFPLLFVKDFGEHGYKVSDEFMTNADVPTIAFDGTVKNPVNPFTGKAINSDEKTAHEQLIITDNAGWDVNDNYGNQYMATSWASIRDNIWDRDQWKFYNEQIVLTEHRLPE
ncbi:MAG: YidC/Oxa1 family membrane protein insertase [Clostridia bacterium]|nr:YidC/Oxa1 family membrane protein insertase [Clostridia bacterium]